MSDFRNRLLNNEIEFPFIRRDIFKSEFSDNGTNFELMFGSRYNVLVLDKYNKKELEMYQALRDNAIKQEDIKVLGYEDSQNMPDTMKMISEQKKSTLLIMDSDFSFKGNERFADVLSNNYFRHFALVVIQTYNVELENVTNRLRKMGLKDTIWKFRLRKNNNIITTDLVAPVGGVVIHG